jgi:AraC family transcriptional regulator, transcriptional activator of the genes for pyochelin and ferripyochelin receptors
MSLSLSAETHQNLWENSSSRLIDASDLIQDCPSELGQGQRRWIQLRQGILLLIHDYELREDTWIESDEPRENYPWLEFGFRMSGCCSSETGPVRGADELFLCVNGLSDEKTQRLSGQRTLQVDIHFTQPALILEVLSHQLDRLPHNVHQVFTAIAEVTDTASISDSLICLYNDVCQNYVDLYLSTTPAIQIALQQLLHCPYHSFTKQLYLESKSLELTALALEQLVEGIADPDPTLCPASSLHPASMLRPDDVERLYHAREILQRNLENPPSLVTLARQVGLNDYKLKSGFRQVFNTTVFGYLRDYRLEQARQLLAERQLSVTEVCNMVGYSSLSAFNAAFRKKFGCNPSVCMKRSQQFLRKAPLPHRISLTSRTAKNSVSSK